MKRLMLIHPYDEVRYLDLDVPAGVDQAAAALDAATAQGLLLDEQNQVIVVDAEHARVFDRGWISQRLEDSGAPRPELVRITINRSDRQEPLVINVPLDGRSCSIPFAGGPIEDIRIEPVMLIHPQESSSSEEGEALREKLLSAYAYRESVEGLPPGTLTSKVEG